MVKTFLKDRLLLILIYIINLVSILSFFYLSVPEDTEFLYPSMIGLFLLIIYLTIDWLRFYPGNRAVARQLRNEDEEIVAHTEEQKAFKKLLEKTVSEHSKKYNDLKEQNKERYYFLSHWMHHLKTPVSVIELIISKERKSDVLDKIQNENKRLHSSIEQGLTMIRMDNFENDFELKSVDLLASLRKLINARKREWIYQSIFPSIEFDEEDAFIITDPKWNEIMIEQIISNAIKYSGQKAGNTKLVFRIEKQIEHVRLSIIDEGVGIPDYDLERVFQPFFTGENGRKHPDSTGIGLYLSKNIADRLGATIEIQSTQDEGTTVKIQWLAGKKQNRL
ncbi:sensor histidine kinase [Bacillus sp. ISL-35]|uniref:sensor histidine kinase n=1 Tax=Bacillus sp. ISL-35 TaxID=2819122 RepID=UPI001BEC1F3A|nr:sensor histidine kinase [Bacillus sp. ISL-35]MBT2679377.1 sensor histidine kinase [Bacillus sp. ISL-35]MBT2703277.1 sensor histidine kinase [Chryseobacterium sp. ISL-80]